MGFAQQLIRRQIGTHALQYLVIAFAALNRQRAGGIDDFVPRMPSHLIPLALGWAIKPISAERFVLRSWSCVACVDVHVMALGTEVR